MANLHPRLHDGPMPNPDIVANFNPFPLPPRPKLAVKLGPQKILIGAIGDFVLAHPLQRVFKRIDPRIRGHSAEFSNFRIDHFRVALDIGIVTKLGI